jgi:periplasmic protein CpxP/Spy
MIATSKLKTPKRKYKMKIKHITLIAALVSTIGLTALPSLAGPGHNHGQRQDHSGMGHHHKMMKMMKKLDLSDNQKLAVHSIFENAMESAEPLHEQMKKIAKALHEEMQKDPVDQNKLRQLAADKANTKVDLMLLHKNTMTKVKAELTEEQIAKLDKMKAKRKQKREERRTNKHGV